MPWLMISINPSQQKIRFCFMACDAHYYEMEDGIPQSVLITAEPNVVIDVKIDSLEFVPACLS